MIDCDLITLIDGSQHWSVPVAGVRYDAGGQTIYYHLAPLDAPVEDCEWRRTYEKQYGSIGFSAGHSPDWFLLCGEWVRFQSKN